MAKLWSSATDGRTDRLSGVGCRLVRFSVKQKEKGEVKSAGWGAVAGAKRILTDEMEECFVFSVDSIILNHRMLFLFRLTFKCLERK